ncbi:RDD family protein [Anabaena sp. PCC 7108]|uniref:RDD family protein n=1 Tax=Anabaena sp. PCC 7108 TaxID=163908 RepID=UPI00034B5B16|nr:RDD family protein [Anabaena sp. PCC 7108]
MSDKQEIEITFRWTEERQKLRKTFQFKPNKDKNNSFKIGRKPNYECDLCLEDPSLEWVHAEIFWKDKNENQEQGFYLKSNISGDNCLKVDNYIEVIGQIVQNDEKPEDKEVKRSPLIFLKTLALKIENLLSQLDKLLKYKYKTYPFAETLALKIKDLFSQLLYKLLEYYKTYSEKSKKEKLEEVKLEVDNRIRIGKTLLKVVSISLCEETNPNSPKENLWKYLNFGVADFEYDLYLLAITKLLHDQYFRLLDFYFHTLIQQRLNFIKSKHLWKHLWNFIKSKLLWKRFLASCIDFVVLIMFPVIQLKVVISINWLNNFASQLFSDNEVILMLLFLWPLIVYPTFFEFKFHNTAKEENYKDKSIKLTIRPFSRRASFGKRLLGIYVTDLNNESISIFSSIARCFFQPLFIFGYLFLIDTIQNFLLPRLGFMPISINGLLIFCLSIILIIINFIMLVLTKNDQSLRDWITKTKIVERKEVPLWNIVVKIKGFLFKRWLPIFLFSIVLFLIVVSPSKFSDYYHHKGNEHLSQAKNYYKEKKYSNAKKEYDKVITYYKIAENLDNKRNYTAYAQYEKGLVNSKLGNSKLGNNQKAIEDFKEAIKDFEEAKIIFENNKDKSSAENARKQINQLQSKVKENTK